MKCLFLYMEPLWKIKTVLYILGEKEQLVLKRVPIVAKTSLLEEDLFQLEPFDYSKLKPFRHSYLSGFYAEKYDTSKDEAYENEMKMRLEKTSLEKILRYGKNFHESNLFSKKISIFNFSFEYALVPIWILKVNYKEKSIEIISTTKI